MQTVKKSHGAYIFGDGKLRTGWTMRRGSIEVGSEQWTVEVTDRHRIGVIAKAGSAPVVRLHPQQTHVPGPGGPVHWAPSRRGGVLTRGANRLTVQQSARSVRVEVTGSWASLELVALTACFAVMSRSRRRTLMIIAIVGATGHGPIG